jgi:hypothetical protein
VSEQILPHENGTVDLLVEIADDPAPEMEGRPKPQSEFSADGGSGKSEISSEALPPIIATANTVSDAIGETRDLARGELEKAEGLREIEKRMRRRRQYPEGKD